MRNLYQCEQEIAEVGYKVGGPDKGKCLYELAQKVSI